MKYAWIDANSKAYALIDMCVVLDVSISGYLEVYMKDVRHLVGERVQILRKRKQLSQEELANRIEIDSKSLSRLERGQHYPSIETLERIRSELGVELKDFFDFDAEPSAEELRDFLLRTASKADYGLLVKMINAVKRALQG